MDSYQTKSMSWDEFLAAWTGRNQTGNNAAITPIELTNSTGTCLEDLNDDCLLEIFSCNSLTSIDLCSLAETCTRFKQITQRVFRKDYGIVYSTAFVCEFISKNEWKVISLQNVERILKHFGLHLSELYISSEYSDGIKSIGKYCDDVTLKGLTICGRVCLDDITVHLDSICQRAQKLTLDGCNFTRANSCFVLNCSSLIELNIDNSSGCVEILKCHFPSLERFTWRFSHIARAYEFRRFRSCDALHKFIKRHGHLKSINICDCCNKLLNVIDKNCKELEELILRDMGHDRFSTLGNFAKLKMLELNFEFMDGGILCDYISLLKAVKSLETIKISGYYNVVPIQIYDVLSQLENLRELHLRDTKWNDVPWAMLAQLRKVNIKCGCWIGCCNEADLTSMIEQLINLEELELHCPRNSQALSEKDFSKICKIVERREHVLTLKCNLSFELKENCDNNRRVKLINV